MTEPLALDALSGKTLAEKYRLVRVLGSGAMGHVYQAEQVGLGRSVAVKILRGSLASNPSSIERFRTEALAASRINHPNAIAIFDFGVTPEGIPYLVMEYLRGRTLAALIDEGPFPPQRVASIGAQILSAVEEAHSCGVIHRDLKSENVMVESLRDGNDFVKVLDFGVARIADRPQTDNLVSGTPEYMAPEQIRGEAVAPAADLYAVGIVLYEMIVGRTPFSGAPTLVVLERHLNELPIPPGEIAPSCPPALGEVILRSLSKDPKARYASAAEMRQALLTSLEAGGGHLVCAQCGTRSPSGMRFCSTCGAELGKTRVANGTVPPQARESLTPTFPFTRTSRPNLESASTVSMASAAAASTRGGRGSRLTSDLPRPSAGLVGRDEEVARVARFFRGGEGAATLAVIGEPGIGKARLVLDVAKGLAGEMVTFVAAPDPSGFQMPWYPILSMLEAVLGLASVPTLEQLTEAVARCGLPERDVPGLAELFALRGPLAPLELAARRRETHAAAMRALRSVSHRFPHAVLCFIDCDRYDRPSRALLTGLAEALDGSGARMILTARNPDAVPPVAALLPLRGLGPAESRMLVAAIIGGTGSLPPADVVHSLTAGSPAALEQFAAWVALGNDAASAPSRLVDLVGSRVGQLSVVERRVLQVLAAQGQVSPRKRVQVALEEIDPEGVALAALRRNGLVVVDDHEVTIPFELVAQVVAEATPADVRRALSRDLLMTFEPAVHPGIVGHHADVVGDRSRAVSCFIAAGDDAVRRFDDPGAATWYGRAIVAARRLLASGDPHGPHWFVEASLRLADALRYVGEVRLAIGCLDEAEAVELHAEHQAELFRARGRIALTTGDTRGATQYLQRAIGAAMRVGDREFLCDTYIDLASALSKGGSPSSAAAELTEAIDLLTMGEGLEQAQGPSRLWLLGFRLAELWMRIGDLVVARRVSEGALALAERIESSTGMGRLHSLLAQIVEAAGDAASALVHRAHALDHLRRLGDRRSTAELLIACARATGDLPPVIASTGSPERTRLTAKRAMQIAHDLAKEVGWDEGVKLTAASGGTE